MTLHTLMKLGAIQLCIQNSPVPCELCNSWQELCNTINYLWMQLCDVKFHSQIKNNPMKSLTRVISSKFLITMLLIFSLFSVTLLSSCVATVQTPHRHRTALFLRHDNGNHYGQQKQVKVYKQGNNKKHGKNKKD